MHSPRIRPLLVLWMAFTGALMAQTPGWYPWAAKGDPTPGEIGLQDWIEKPAGRGGRILRKDDGLLSQGRPLRLWGLNLCYAHCAPPKEVADKRAAFYPKYGINSVRLHKFIDGPGWSGIQSPDSCVEYDPAGLERMDYQVAKLKEAGIYVTLSATFGPQKLGPADRRLVPWLEEFGTFENGRNRVSTPHSAIHFSPELQALHLRQMVNLLRHRNPHTGLTYAEDPAVAFIEIINEQSILFYTSMGALKASATLRRQTGERFADWLRRKHGSHEKLVEAWGSAALNAFVKEGFAGDEHLDRANLLPLGNPWYWDPRQLQGSQAALRERLLDSLQFLYELQCEFYDRYVKALREAGYAGEILASNWQAGRAFSHFYNLHSDARVGTVDRHNYFGGGGKDGAKFDHASLLRVAGAELLSSGLQQVSDRPFMLSEWIHVFPNEWGVEGPALLGAYGYGLQGWDVSYMFQNGDNGGFSERLGRDRWDVTAPQILGIFPAVARQVLRGDVRESRLQARLYVHVPSLRAGRLGFEDRTSQAYDLKGFDSDKVPARALAVARCAVEFTDVYRDTPQFDLAPFEKAGALESSTGQLRWTEAGAARNAGWFTIDTPATKAVVGFAAGQVCRLRSATLTLRSPFAALYLTARGPGETLANARSLLVVALARARNTGMTFNAPEDTLIERGRAPILLEPVRATLELSGRSVAAVNLLDHDGRRTGRSCPVTHGRLEIDTGRDQTPYYEVVLVPASP